MKTNIFFITTILCIFLNSIAIQSQNRYEEAIKYEVIDEMIVFPATINGKEHKFIFDPMCLPAILDDYADEMGFQKNNIKVDYSWGNSEVVSGGSLLRFGVGDILFVEKTGALSIRNEYLKKNGISGMVNATPFIGYVVTIDSKNKTMLLSTPYKPNYISLKNKVDLHDQLRSFNIRAGQEEVALYLDFSADRKGVLLSTGDAEKTATPGHATAGPITLPSIVIANNVVEGMEAMVSASESVSTIGTAFLDKGVLSLDYVKGRLYFQLYDDIDPGALVSASSNPKAKTTETLTDQGIIILNRINFADYVFDYKSGDEWKYRGDKPAIIDFWAEWCGPCKRISKSLEELADEYAGQIVIYKINYDEEPEIAKYFEIQSLPSLLYIPVDGEPEVLVGASPKEDIIKHIEKLLLKRQNKELVSAMRSLPGNGTRYSFD